MLAIYKKELKQYFHSMIGFAFLAFFLVIIGIYTWAYNFSGGYGNFELTLGSIAFLFVLLVPILTMRIIAEENHQKTNQLLYTAPISITRIIIAKYLAVLTLFAIGILIISCYPLIIYQYSDDMHLASSYSSVIGFFLLGAACISVCMFISSLTESQAIAAVVSFIVMLVTFLMTSLTGMLPTEALPQCIMLAVLWVCVILFLNRMLHKPKPALVLGIAGEAVIWILYFVKSSLYESLVTNILNILAISSRYDDFSMGILNYDSIVYYVSIIIFFVFLTIQMTRSQQFKTGAYSSLLTVLTLAIVVVANLMFSKLELSSDLSSEGYFSLTGDTEEVVKQVDQNIVINYMVSDGQEDDYIDRILKKYKKLSGYITVKKVDPVVNPGFGSSLGIDDTVENNDVIVQNEETGSVKYLSNADLVIEDYDYYTGSSSTTLDVEGQVTAAIQKVIAEDTTKVYVMTKHSEFDMGSEADDIFDKMNMETEELELATLEAVPDDCDILIINGPSTDLTEQEKKLVLKYLKAGGSAMLTVAYSEDELTNFDAILEYYGIHLNRGVVYESTGNYMQYLNYIIPFTSSESDLLSDLNGYLVFPSAAGMTADSGDALRDGVTVTSLLETSESAFVKTNPSSGETSKEDGDVDGPFALGYSVTEEIDDDTETNLIVYSSAGAFSESFLAAGELDNASVLKQSLSSINTSSNITEVSIDQKSLSYSYVSMTVSSQLFWAAMVVVILPAALLIAGFVIWFTRRRKG
ncbi:MAG: Gldg family protein [Clostridiaceae bacterium]|nr:Gldg family protein [Clostridiaceae bacterium]